MANSVDGQHARRRLQVRLTRALVLVEHDFRSRRINVCLQLGRALFRGLAMGRLSICVSRNDHLGLHLQRDVCRNELRDLGLRMKENFLRGALGARRSEVIGAWIFYCLLVVLNVRLTRRSLLCMEGISTRLPLCRGLFTLTVLS